MLSTVTSRRARRYGAVVAAVGAVLSACVGSGDDARSSGTSTVTSLATTAVPTSSMMVEWSSSAEMLTLAPEQALPPVGAVIAWATKENVRLGATNNITHPIDASNVGGVEVGAPCSQIGFVDLRYSSTAEGADLPAVGIAPFTLSVSVCDDEAGATALDDRHIGFADLDQGDCVVDEREQEPIVVICPVQPGEQVRWWNASGVAHRGQVSVTANIDFGPETDPVDARESVVQLLGLALEQIDSRLG